MITPLNSYLFAIKVFKITDLHEIKDFYVGPLLSKMIVTKETLGLLVNATILNIFRKQNPTPLWDAQEQRKMYGFYEKFNKKLLIFEIFLLIFF